MNEFAAGTSFNTFEKQDKILVGLSGGVDSSVCIDILRSQGFAVEALVIHFSPAHDAAVESAKTIAAQLDIPLHIECCEDIFEREVVAPFCESYASGTTPSPCILCNPRVKFKVLADVADRLGIRFFATGHYARVEEENGIYYIAKAVSEARDQSYMLYGLPQEILSRLCLPVGEFEKTEIREIAQSLQLASADAPDSQEICFIPDGEYAAYIEARGYTAKQGSFIGPDGENLGKHKGVWHYTVGQRKGLGIAYGTPVFVKRICENGDILLAKPENETYGGIRITGLHRADGKAFAAGDAYTVKVRSRATPAPCVIEQADTTSAVVRFAQPQRAPAPGQAAVFYAGSLVIGGGIIAEMLE